MLFIQMTGLSGSGKSTLSNIVKSSLLEKGVKVEIIDGDEYREGLCNDLGFSKEDRNKNIRRLGFVAKVLARNDVIAIMAAINPYNSVREELSRMGSFVKTVYVKCDIDTLKARDPKGLYKRALLKDCDPEKIHNFTGISDPFEPPENPDLIINTGKESLIESANKLYNFILNVL
jgi:adenylylsulfate kinase